MDDKPRRGKRGPKPYLSKSKEELIEIIRRLKRRRETTERYLRNELQTMEAVCSHWRGLAAERGEECDGLRERLWGLFEKSGQAPADTKPQITRSGNVIHLHQHNKR